MQAKLFIAINIALLATLPSAHAGLQKGCKKVMQPYPDVVCRCGYRENASYPPDYEEYMQEGTVWEYVGSDQRDENYDPILSDGRKCELENYLYNEWIQKQQDNDLQQL